jgi:hypothetical protein
VSIVTEERQHRSNTDIAGSKVVGAERLHYDSLLKRFRDEFERARPGVHKTYLTKAVLHQACKRTMRNARGVHRLRRRSAKRGAATNPKQHYVNGRVRSKMGKLSRSEWDRFRVQAAQDWDCLSPDERQQVVQDWQECRRSTAPAAAPTTADARASGSNVAVGCNESTAQMLWRVWDETWPVGADHIDQLLRRLPRPSSAKHPGLVRAGTVVRDTHMPSMAVPDPKQPGARLPRRTASATCAQLHPGHCVTRDAHKRDLVVHIAKNLTTMFSGASKKHVLGNFYMLTVAGPDGVVAWQYPVAVCALRFARPPGQVFGIYEIENVEHAEGRAKFTLARAARGPSDPASRFQFTHEVVVHLLDHPAWSAHIHDDLTVDMRRLQAQLPETISREPRSTRACPTHTLPETTRSAAHVG